MGDRSKIEWTDASWTPIRARLMAIQDDDWTERTGQVSSLDWIIAGGESGPHARPALLLWFRSVRDQCAAAGVPFFFKQWGEWLPWHQFNSAAGVEDDAEQTRFATMEWEGGRWTDAGKPQWCDVVDGNIDDEHCVGRVGKKAAGRLLDGVTHDAFPEARR